MTVAEIANQHEQPFETRQAKYNRFQAGSFCRTKGFNPVPVELWAATKRSLSSSKRCTENRKYKSATQQSLILVVQ